MRMCEFAAERISPNKDCTCLTCRTQRIADEVFLRWVPAIWPLSVTFTHPQQLEVDTKKLRDAADLVADLYVRT